MKRDFIKNPYYQEIYKVVKEEYNLSELSSKIIAKSIFLTVDSQNPQKSRSGLNFIRILKNSSSNGSMKKTLERVLELREFC